MKKYVVRILMTIVLCTFISVPASAKTYHVGHNNLLSWSASYEINTAGNNIKSVSSIKVSGGPTGTISHKYITHEAPNKVTLHLAALTLATMTLGGVTIPSVTALADNIETSSITKVDYQSMNSDQLGNIIDTYDIYSNHIQLV